MKLARKQVSIPVEGPEWMSATTEKGEPGIDFVPFHERNFLELGNERGNVRTLQFLAAVAEQGFSGIAATEDDSRIIQREGGQIIHDG